MTLDQIRAKIEELGVSREWLAKQCHYSKTSIVNMLAPGGSNRSQKSLARISEVLVREEMRQAAEKGFSDGVISAHGVFEIRQSPEDSDLIDRASRAVGAASIVDFCRDAILLRAREIMASHGVQARRHAPPSFAHLTAAAGPAIEAEVMETSDAIIRVRLFGDSMEPLFSDGQIIEMNSRVASRSPFMKKGLIYLVRIDGGFAVKRYSTRKPTPEEVGQEWASKGRVGILESLNPAYPPITIRGDIEWLAWIDPKGGAK